MHAPSLRLRRPPWIAGLASALVSSVAVAGPSSDTVKGYNGSGVTQGYNGSGVTQGYNGSGVTQGYNGSGVTQGYNGSGVTQGYNGSASPRGYASMVACYAFGDGFSSAAMGPVESISRNGRAVTLVIVGQAFEIPAADAAGFRVGDFAVGGIGEGIGATAYHVNSVYVPGVSKVRLKGPVAAVDASIGTASLGTVTVDYSALLSTDPDAAPDVGDSFATVGIQPVPGGVVLAGPSTAGTVGCSALGGRL